MSDVQNVNIEKDNSNDGQKIDVTDCRARILGLANLVECGTKVRTCRWYHHFGEAALCVHPSNMMIAKGVLPPGWSLPCQMEVINR